MWPTASLVQHTAGPRAAARILPARPSLPSTVVVLVRPQPPYFYAFDAVCSNSELRDTDPDDDELRGPDPDDALFDSRLVLSLASPGVCKHLPSARTHLSI